jgi:hypothetical protein
MTGEDLAGAGENPTDELLVAFMVVTAELRLITQNVRTWRDGTPTPRSTQW